MARRERGAVYRLPSPPILMGKDYATEVQTLNKHLDQTNDILNQALQVLQNRTNTIQQVGAKPPVPVSGLTVTGKQGLFYLVWNRVMNVDGYIIVQASDAAMIQLIGRYTVPDSEQCRLDISVGNVAVTNTFQVYAYQGPKIGPPSPAVTATTVVYSLTPEAAPPAPPLSPRHPKFAPPRTGPNL